MKFHSLFLFTGAMFCILATSCEDFIEQDISKKNVQILAPVDGLRTNSLTMTFWWEELDGAEQYKLQLVTPSFSAAQFVLLDTLVAGNRFDFQVSNPGTFQWRLKAINNGYETGYTTRSFTIDSTSDLSLQTLNLLFPSENYFTNNSQITFKWTDLYNAESYHFIIADNIGGSIILDSTIVNTQLTLNLFEGSFDWKVRAENSTSNTTYTQRTANIDLSPPLTPYNISPADSDTISISSTLTWSHSSDISVDSLEIYTDIGMSNLHTAETVTSGTFLFSGTQFQFYYWRLKSYDYAGNESSWSTLKKFYVQ